MDKFNFLHYGPGGNAFVERKLLGPEFTSAVFPDQPPMKTERQPYASLVAACAEQLAASPHAADVAHSFGCDLLMGAIKARPLKTDTIVLVSPLRSIPRGFYNLGMTLQSAAPVSALAEALRAATGDLDRLSPEKFWKLVGAVAVHPQYAAAFWRSPDAMARYHLIASDGPGFDSTEWQTVIQDYLFSTEPVTYSALLGKNARVVLGENDPYLDIEKDLVFWRQTVGADNVFVLKSGHYPHIETQSEFTKILRNIK